MYLQKDSTNKIDPRLQEQGGQLCNKEVHDNEAAAIVERRLSMIAISFNFLWHPVQSKDYKHRRPTPNHDLFSVY